MAKDLSSWHKFLLHAIRSSLRHPRKPIEFYQCNKCGTRFLTNRPECPKCGEEVHNPAEKKTLSPVPWYASMLLILLGVVTWATVGIHHQTELIEAARILIYAPMGTLFGLSWKR